PTYDGGLGSAWKKRSVGWLTGKWKEGPFPAVAVPGNGVHAVGRRTGGATDRHRLARIRAAVDVDRNAHENASPRRVVRRVGQDVELRPCPRELRTVEVRRGR